MLVTAAAARTEGERTPGTMVERQTSRADGRVKIPCGIFPRNVRAPQGRVVANGHPG
ncbi:hypothetical protein STSP_53800 [Streptomyces jeddahensis]|uniref:Uncharacterized protein n=1 Tax=Streptomyces jeddahensis TaxID=1716141 RepID=A0A177HKG8_9ACTN|nr:hypothetical protein STSP_53800 [Streptomyces jeddahensis]